MTHTLITFLGKVQKGGNYQRTTYRFEDGAEVETRYFGLALREHLQAQRLVILGTSGSMWDVLLMDAVDLTDSDPEAVAELSDAAIAKRVDQPHLDRLIPRLAARLGCEVRLVIIPYAQTEAEQLTLLQIMAEEVDERERVSLDVTHGFRHLPMLALLSALHLEATRRAIIAGIYYGAYDPDIGEAPVYDLKGLLHIADWIGALHRFDKDGDYGVFAPLLERDGLTPTEAKHLHRAAFYERTSNARDAIKELANFGKTLERGLPGVGTLFAEPLHKRTQWQRGKEHNAYAQQRHLACVYLEKGDYIRAAIYAYEAFVTQLVDRAGGKTVHYKDRGEAAKAYEDDRSVSARQKSDYWLLKNLRNTLAHGNEPNLKEENRWKREQAEKVAGIVASEERLGAKLQRLVEILLP